MNAAIILARGGSKRIHKKNIKSFHGKPIIAYSIEAAKKTNVFDKVIVSTDSEEIAKTAKKYGAEVPFMRPKEISDDETPTAPVLVHAIDWLTNNSEKPSFVPILEISLKARTRFLSLELPTLLLSCHLRSR